jgi:hypothetical protein
MKGDGKASREACLLLELLVDCVQRILDCDTLEVTSSDRQTQWPYQVNLLDRWGHQVHLENVLVLDGVRRRVELPVPHA